MGAIENKEQGMKRLVITFVLVLSSSILFAQTLKTHTGKVSVGDYYGTETYSYYLDDYGHEIRHGKYTYSGVYKETLPIGNINNTDKITVSATYSHGKYNGVFTQKETHRSQGMGITADSWEEYSVTFKDGVPSGPFSKKEMESNGVLTQTVRTASSMKGALGLSYFDGALDSQGYATGRWTIKTKYNEYVLDMINGYAVSTAIFENDHDHTVIYKTDQTEKMTATKYAKGEISFNELIKQNYIVFDSVRGIFDEEEDLKPKIYRHFRDDAKNWVVQSSDRWLRGFICKANTIDSLENQCINMFMDAIPGSCYNEGVDAIDKYNLCHLTSGSSYDYYISRDKEERTVQIVSPSKEIQSYIPFPFDLSLISNVRTSFLVVFTEDWYIDVICPRLKEKSVYDKKQPVPFPTSENIKELIEKINHYIEINEDSEIIIELLHSAQAIDPKNASLFYVEGNVYKQLGDVESAAKLYEKSSEVDPYYEFGLFGLGTLYYDKAIEIQNNAREEPDDDKYFALVKKMGETLEKAIRPFEESFAKTDDPELKMVIAEYLKIIYFSLRDKNPEYEALSKKYEAFLKGEIITSDGELTRHDDEVEKAKAAEAARLEAEAKVAEEKTAKAKAEEEARLAAEAKAAEEKAAKAAEEARLAAEAKTAETKAAKAKAEEAKLTAEEKTAKKASKDAKKTDVSQIAPVVGQGMVSDIASSSGALRPKTGFVQSASVGYLINGYLSNSDFSHNGGLFAGYDIGYGLPFGLFCGADALLIKEFVKVNFNDPSYKYDSNHLIISPKICYQIPINASFNPFFGVSYGYDFIKKYTLGLFVHLGGVYQFSPTIGLKFSASVCSYLGIGVSAGLVF